MMKTRVVDAEPGATPPTEHTRPRRRLLRILPVAIIVAIGVAGYAAGLHEMVSFEALLAQRGELRAFVEQNQVWAIAAYVAFYVVMASLSLPGAWWISVLGGFLFGWLVGGILAVISATIGAIVIFLAARTSFGSVFAKRAGPMLQRLAGGFRKDSFSYLLMLRLIPVIPFWITNIAPALFGVRLRTFSLATLIGIIPATFAFASAGDGLDGIIAAQEQARAACLAAARGDCGITIRLSDIVTPKILLAAAVLALIGTVPLILRRWTGAPFGSLDAGSKAP